MYALRRRGVRRVRRGCATRVKSGREFAVPTSSCGAGTCPHSLISNGGLSGLRSKQCRTQGVHHQLHIWIHGCHSFSYSYLLFEEKEKWRNRSVLNCVASATKDGTSRYATRPHYADLLSRSSNHCLRFHSAFKRLGNVKLLGGAAVALEFFSAVCGILTFSRR